MHSFSLIYHIYPKYLDTKYVDQDQALQDMASDQGLHYLSLYHLTIFVQNCQRSIL